MDPKKIIRRYIGTPGWVRVVAILLTAALAVSLSVAILVLNTETGEPVDFYPSETPENTMAYIDVVGVSNWLYQYDNEVYYSVEDSYGFLYTVRLNDSQYKKMAAQQEYWNRESDAEPQPEPYRLVGLVQATSSRVRSSLCQAWEISGEDYNLYFGDKLLNATTSLSSQNAGGWFAAALFAGVFALVSWIPLLVSWSVAKISLEQLEKRGLLEKAAQQLENPINQTIVGKNRGILTQDFLFGKGTGVAVCYDDILWAYQQDRRRNFMVSNSTVLVCTRFWGGQQAIDLGSPDRKGLLSQALLVIGQRNPNVLLGYNDQNRRAFAAIQKAAK